ncbi:hypothetical protein P3G55_18245 [Leptospira sp. 96542]|nr:hypothetical protein [Leptospira sp. 96542]
MSLLVNRIEKKGKERVKKMAGETVEELNKKLKIQSDIIKGYEKVLRLNEQELANADEIIRMYEQIIDYSRSELKEAKETVQASSMVSNLSRDELMDAFDKIKKLEESNRKLREESLKFNKD